MELLQCIETSNHYLAVAHDKVCNVATLQIYFLYISPIVRETARIVEICNIGLEIL